MIESRDFREKEQLNSYLEYHDYKKYEKILDYYLKKNQSKMTKRDWIWLFSVTFTALLIVISIRLSDDVNLLNVLGYIANSVSIALALLAIVISINENNKTSITNQKINEILSRMDEKIKSLDKKVDNFDSIPPKILSILSDVKEFEKTYKNEKMKSGKKTENNIQHNKKEIESRIKKLRKKLENLYNEVEDSRRLNNVDPELLMIATKLITSPLLSYEVMLKNLYNLQTKQNDNSKINNNSIDNSGN